MKSKLYKLPFSATEKRSKKKLMYALLLSIFFHSLSAQLTNLVWAKQFSGSSTALLITKDASGNIYTAGYFGGTVDFDPGVGVFNLNSSTGSGFVTKIDASGNFVWAKNLPSSEINGLSLDASGNVYTTGYFVGTKDFDTGTGVFYLTSPGTFWDVFIHKLDASGNFVWVKQLGGPNHDYPSSILLSANGNIYTTGKFSGTSDFDPGVGTYNLNASAGSTFVSKLDASGNFVWAKQFGTGVGMGLFLDASENVYTTGNFNGTGDFDPGAGVYNLTSLGGNDAFVSKLDASGNFIWAKQFGGINNEMAGPIKADGSGNLYILGGFEGTVDFDPGTGTYNLACSGSQDIFITKLDASGNFSWAKGFGGIGYEQGSSIELDASGNIYSTGFFSGTVDFDPGIGTSNLTSNGSQDAFISKLNSSGNYVWVNQMGGAGGTDIAASLVLSGSDIYTCGGFSGTFDFDPGIGTYNLTASSSQDAFILKLSQTPTTQLSSGSCGLTETSLDDYLYCDYVPGATDYKFEMTDPGNNVTVYYKGNSSYLFLMSWVPGIGYGVTYNIRVSAQVGGNWTPWGPACNVTTPPPPTTKLSSGSCGITETDLQDYLYCDYIPGATDYKYELTDQNNNVMVYYKGNSSYLFLLSWVPGIGYGVTYSIRVAAAAGGTWTAWGSACNVTTPAPPTTKLSSSSCGITETDLQDYLYCNYVPGATDYKYEITDPNNNVTTYYKGNSSYLFLMSWVPGIGYGVTYSIRVAAAAGGTWTAWGPACNVTTPAPPTTQLSSGSCGITETNLEDYLYCDYVPGATDYRYEITDPNNNVTVYYRGNSSYVFLMSWMPGVGYGVTYSIRVAAAAGGTWTAYGPACNVTTPAPPTTKLASGSCGITETSLEDYLYCDYVPGATDYRYEITDPNNNVTVYYRGNSSYVFLMSWMPGVGYGVTYSIRVAAAVGGTWTAYGQACNVTTPAPPTTQLASGSCGITESSLQDYLYCDYVPGATDYKYQITDPSNNVSIYYRGNSSYLFSMSWPSGISYGVTYAIKVSAAVGGTWTPWGSSCNVTTPAGPKPAQSSDTTSLITGLNELTNGSNGVISIQAFPNPISNEFQVDLGKSYENVEVVISNSLGQNVFTKKFDSADKLTLSLEEPKGIYFLTVRSGKNTSARLKIIKE